MHTRPVRFIIIGFVLVLFGFLTPLLMVGRFIEASFFWGFLSYGASVAGLFLGMLGAASYIRARKD